MASAGAFKSGIYCAGEGVNTLELKGKADGEIKSMPPVGPPMVVSRGEFRVAPDLARWRGFPIIA